ncbi:FAD-dependent oxidoreductase [Vibrio sp. PP-XX7]
MPQQHHFDVIVIGSGPGEEGAAMGLTKAGFNVAIIEKESSVGGGCTHWGTIPSKTLRHAVSRIIEFNTNPYFAEIIPVFIPRSQVFFVMPKPSLISKPGSDKDFTTEISALIFGLAQFIDSHRVEVIQPDGSKEQYTADKFVIATGSRPYHPQDIDFNHDRIYDSDSILNLAHDPRHIIIYGAGVIGCEYASIFRGLDVKTDLINTRDRLLSFWIMKSPMPCLIISETMA